jgi:hypothetical protein
MKINLPLSAAARGLAVLAAPLVSAFSLHAAPLAGSTAAHTRPDESAPVITVLAAGTDPVPSASATAPAGWTAVELSGPFEAFVQRKDLLKSLDVRPGASLYRAPDATSGAIAVAEKGDPVSIIGLHGKWTQVRLEKKLTGYIHAAGATALPPVVTDVAPAPAPAPAHTDPAPAPFVPAPVGASARGVAAGGEGVPVVGLGGTSASLPRYYQGKFVSTRSPFHPRRPFDWALVDNANKRIAYLDISRLLLTEQIESYADHAVVVYGETRPSPDGKDFVIAVESLQLR